MNITFFKFIIQLTVIVSWVIGSVHNENSTIDKDKNNDINNDDITTKKPTEWAVFLYDKKKGRYFTEKEVNQLAGEKNFINLGKVGELNGYWRFRMKEGEPEKDEDDGDDIVYDDEDEDIIGKYENEVHNKVKRSVVVDDLLEDEVNPLWEEDNVEIYRSLKLKNNKRKRERHHRKRDSSKKFKRTVTEAEDDLFDLSDVYWFEKQKYVQRQKREFIAYDMNDLLNNNMKKYNVFDDNIRRKRWIRSYKLEHERKGQAVNKKEFYDKLRNLHNFEDVDNDSDFDLNESPKKMYSRGSIFHDSYSDVSFDFDALNFTDPFFFRQWHLVNFFSYLMINNIYILIIF